MKILSDVESVLVEDNIKQSYLETFKKHNQFDWYGRLYLFIIKKQTLVGLKIVHRIQDTRVFEFAESKLWKLEILKSCLSKQNYLRFDTDDHKVKNFHSWYYLDTPIQEVFLL